MMMDKGLSTNQAKDFIESASLYTDIVKLGFGTSIVSTNTEEKIKLYQQAGMKVYLGGTLFESFIIRGMYKEYQELLKKWNLQMCEVSDGCINLEHEKKCEYIHDLSKTFCVVSEVGSKDENTNLSTKEWCELMSRELEAGSWKVISEAREGGNIGVFNKKGEVKSNLINTILEKIPSKNIIWEAPKKEQQVWFIKSIGANVNLGNISYNEVIPLETLRIGLRGDTFFDYLNK